MDFYFFDSSAVVKNYIIEVGTHWIKGIFNSTVSNVLYCASITQVEVISAFARRVKGNSLSPADYLSSSQQFKADFANDFRVIELTPKLLTEAVGMVESYSLRGYDAVQLAASLQLSRELAALKFNPLIFVSADNELNSAAQAEGLQIENPNNYP